ncbi:MAG: hypothetical protein NTW16_08885 [Bacteroidetes bacterium]|nr:hypothetical protein [Bacteroidota bacterium]
MKNGKRIAMIIIPPILVILYLFFNHTVFNGSNDAEGEARLVDISLPIKTDNPSFQIDRLTPMTLNDKDALCISGWVFNKNLKKGNRNLYFVLKSKGETLIFDIVKDDLSRPDVSRTFQLVGGIDNHGFELFLPLYQLKEFAYQIGFVVEDETGKYYSLTNETLKISGGKAFLLNAGSKPETEVGTEPVSHQVSLDIQKPTKKISYFFDKVESTGKISTIVGWAFLTGLDAGSLKSYILLKKPGKKYIFSVNIRERKDITKAFNKYGFNLDSTGFKATISSENLEAGNYQLGLYVTLVYSQKFIDIGK